MARHLGQRHRVRQVHQPAHHRDRLDPQRILCARKVDRGARIAAEHGRHQLRNRRAVRQAQHRADLVGRNPPAARAIGFQIGVGNRLVEDRKPVTHRSFGGIGDQPDGGRLGLDALFLQDRTEMREQHVGGDTAKVEALAARQDRHWDLVDLGRRKQEFDVRRRLFERFQKCVERVTRQHMHFVNDIDLVARRHRGIAHRLDNLAHIVDAGVRRGVHLDHVDMAPLGDRAARFAHPARIDRRPALPVRTDAVERLGDQPRGRRLADPAHPGHQKGVRQPVARDRIAERPHHRILPDQFGKGLRPIFAGKDAVRPVRGRRGRRLWQVHAQHRSVVG